MKIINIATFEEFDELYKQYQKSVTSDNQNSLILLFTASDDPQTKEPWCPDCRISKPVIDKTVQDFQFNDVLSLAVVQVGTKDEWKDDQNPYRLHELRITAIPTLISLKNVSKRR